MLRARILAIAVFLGIVGLALFSRAEPPARTAGLRIEASPTAASGAPVSGEMRSFALRFADRESAAGDLSRAPAGWPVELSRVPAPLLRGADPSAVPEPIEPLPGVTNVLHGSDPALWRTGGVAYGAVRVRSAYPGIDVVYRGTPFRLDLEIHVAPGADPSAVRLDVPGLQGIAEDGAGGIRLRMDGQDRGIPVPLAFERRGDEVIPVSASLRSRADGFDLDVAEHDAANALDVRISMPVPPHDGAAVDRREGSLVAVDRLGGVYLAAHVDRAGGDVLVAKLDATRREFAWVTYLGGAGDDVPTSLAVDASGRIAVVGRTSSTEFVAPGSGSGFVVRLGAGGGVPELAARLDGDLRGVALGPDGAMVAVGELEGDACIVRVGPDGAVATTRFGGEGADAATGVAVAPDGAFVVVGSTSSSTLPGATWLDGTTGEPAATGRDAFVARFDASGTLEFIRRIGEAGDDAGRAVALDPSGRAWVAGELSGDAFVVAVGADGTVAAELRRLGGDGRESATSVSVNGSGRIAVAGWSESISFPVTAAALQSRPGGGADAFVVTLRPDGSAVAYASLLGAERDEVAHGVAFDDAGRVWVSGVTASSSLPAGNPVVPASGGGDAFVADLPAPTDDVSLLGTCPGTISFDNSAGTGLWQTATNWNLDRVPNATDDVCIDNFAVTMSGTGQLAGTVRVQGAGGSLTVSGGDLTISGGASEIQAPFTLSGGTLTSNGTLSISGSFTWSGGTLAGPGTTTASGGLTINAAGKNLSAHTLINTGTANWSGTGNVNLNTNAVFTNALGATFNAQNDQFFTGSSAGTFNNAGTFNKTSGTATTNMSLVFNNSGTVSVTSGAATILSLNNGGTHTGSFTAAAGATLDFGGLTNTLQAASSVAGAGTILFSAGNTVVNGTYNVAGLTSVTNGTVDFEATTSTTGTLTQSAGDVGGAGTLNVTGLFTWTGGTQSGSGITNANAGMSISGSGKNLNTRTLNNVGTATWTGVNNVNLSNNAVFNNPSGSTFNAQNDQFFTGGAAGTFNNGGTFNKSGGTATTNMSLVFNNTGTTNVTASGGTLSLNNGGTHTGSFTAATGATLDFGGGTHALQAASSVTGAGTVLFSAGTANVNGTYNVTGLTNVTNGIANFESVTSTTGTLTQSGGTVGGAGTLNVTGLFTWTGGTQDDAGITNANAGMSISGNSKTLNTRTLNNVGTATWTGVNNISFSNNAVFNNPSGSTFNAQNNQFITGTGTFQNGGTFTKSAGAGVTNVSVVFNNGGSVSSAFSGGTIALNTGGTHTGSFAAAAGATLDFGGGTHNLQAASSVTGTGTILFSAGTVNVNGTYNVTGLTNVTNGTVNFESPTSTMGTLTQSAGNVGGAGTIDVTGLFTWTGGTQSDAGITNANAGMSISGNSKTLDTRTLNNIGTATWTGVNNISLFNNAVFNNPSGSTFNAQNNQFISGTGVFQNAGTFTKSAGAGVTNVSLVFNNSGSVSSAFSGGTIALNTGGTHTGSFTAASGATLDFGGGTHNLEAASSVTGTGTILFSAGTTNVNGTYNPTGLTSVTNGTVNFESVTSTTGTLTQSAGVVGGAGTLDVTGLFTWTGGTQADGGITNANGGMTLSGPNGRSIDTRTVNNANNGTATWSGTGNFTIFNAGTFNNPLGSTFNIQNNQFMGSTGVFNNAGTFTKSAGAGVSSISVVFNNTGSVTSTFSGGTLDLSGGGIHTGTFSAASGATLEFGAGTTTFQAASSVTGAGTVRFSGGTSTINGTYNVIGLTDVTFATVNFESSPCTTGTLTQSGGVVGGAGTLNVTGLFTWTSGTQNGAGVTNANGGMTISTSGSKSIDARTVNNANNGTATWTGTGSVFLSTNAVFNNLAGSTFSVTNAAFWSGTGTFANSGTFTKSGGAGTTTMSVVFDNSGTVNDNFSGGTLALSDGTATGSFNVAAGAVLDFASGTYNLQPASSVTGAGTVRASGGIVNANGTYNVTGLTDVTFGTMNFLAASSTTGTLTQSNGTVGGAGTLNVTGLFTWTGGTQSGSGITNANGGMSISGSFFESIDARTINNANNGTATWSAANQLFFSNNGTFNNLAGSTFNVQNAQPMSGTGTFSNAGTFNKGNAGVTTVFNAFTNTGTVVVGNGELQVSSGGTYTQTAGITRVTGGLLSAVFGPVLNINGGILEGTGTIAGSVATTNGGAIAPGLSPGILTIDGGPWVPSATSAMNVELGGTTVGTGYDRLALTGAPAGNVFLAGTLNVSLVGGFQPALADAFTILTATSVGGTFSTTNLPPLTGGNLWQVEYTPTTVVLRVVPPANADMSITKVDGPDPVNVGGNVTYTLTIGNVGPDPATGVTVVDTLPASVTFVSASPSQGTCSHAAGVVTCPMGNVAVNGSAGVTIVVTTTAASAPSISNTATVAATEADLTPANNTAVATTTVNPVANLSITKGDAPDPIQAGGALTYTLDVSNAGPSTATSLTVTDNLPAGSTFQSAAGTGWTCSHAAGVVTCTRGSLAVGAAPQITIAVTAPGTPGAIVNNASVTASEFDPVTPNTATATTNVTAVADLTIAKGDAPDPVNAAAVLTYTLDVSNVGPSAANTVSVTDTLPAGVTFVSASGTGWTCNHASGVVTCTRATLAVGGAPAITITVTAPNEGTSLTNNAAVTAAEFDPTTPNTASASTTVTPIADLSVAKSDAPDPVDPAANVTYTLAVSNAGPSTATSLSAADTLPAGTTFVSASGTGWTCNEAAGVVTCTRASLAPGAAPAITIVATAPAAGGVLNNTATVTSAVTDPVAGNNTDAEPTTVRPAADLSIVKGDSADPVDAGAAFSYALDVANAGPDAASTITVADTLPAGATFVSAAGTGWTCGQAAGVVTCTRATLAVGAAPTITINVTAPGSGPIVNGASVAATGSVDLVTGNNSDSETTAITPISDLSIVKSDSPDPVNINQNFTYTLAVTNLGPSPAISLTVTDTLPGVAFVSASGTGWTCNEAAGTVTCARASLAVGAAPAITITVTAPGTTGALSNTATVSGGQADPVPGNNSDTEGTTVSQITADLSITKGDAPDPVNAAAALVYTLNVANAGPDPATNLTVTDTLPAGVTFASATGTGWTCGQAAGVVTCTRPTLAVGAAPAITINVNAPAQGGPITNTATVASETADANLANNTAAATTAVTPIADLSIVKSDAPDPVLAQGTLTYTLTVSNAGPSDAATVSVADTLPAGTTFVSASGTGWTCGHAAGVVTCTRPAVPVGAAPAITVTVTAPDNGGSITNTASVSTATTDPAPANNTDSEATTVTAVSDLSIVKTGPGTVDAGSPVPYVLTVTNAGPSVAPSVSVTDTLPAGTTFQSASGAGWSCSNSAGVVTCTRANLAVGVAPPINLVVTAPVAAGSFQNTAGVSTTANDPGGANNASTASAFVLEVQDIAVSITDAPDPVALGQPLTYTVTVSNLGPSAIDFVPLEVLLDPSVTFVSASGTGWTCLPTSGGVHCELPGLAAGASSTVTVVVVAPVETGTVTTVAESFGEFNDPDVENNLATAQTTVEEPETCSIDALIEGVRSLRLAKATESRLVTRLQSAGAAAARGDHRQAALDLKNVASQLGLLRNRPGARATVDALLACTLTLQREQVALTGATPPPDRDRTRPASVPKREVPRR